MDIRIYAINLDRSFDRWTILQNKAELLGFPLVRVPGVDGTKTPPEDRIDCDARAFARNNGRTVLPGEYGCYRSHLKALAAFVETGDAVGLIVEDDIELCDDLLVRVGAAVEALPRAGVIKFASHRIVGFRRAATSKAGDEIGRTMHGPQGSGSCYAVTRAGAQKLIETLKIMAYPWDVALERGWASGVPTYATRVNVTFPMPAATTIATQALYRSVKFPWWKRFKTYGTRIVETACRIVYANLG